MGMHYARHDGEAEDGRGAERTVSAALLPVMTRRSNSGGLRWRSPIRWTTLAGIIIFRHRPASER